MKRGDAFRIRVLGCGDAFGSGGRFQTAFLFELGDERILVDCGTTTLVACHRAGIDPACIDAVLISHLHGDHFGGLPFLILDQHFRARRRRALTLLGPPGVADRLRVLMQASFPGAEAIVPGFPLEIREIEPGGPPQPLLSAEVSAVEVDHPSGAPSLGFRIAGAGRVVAYSGDTRWTDQLVDLCHGSDLCICECYAFSPGVEAHMNYETLEKHRPSLGAGRVVLTHLGPEMLARREDLAADVLEDGAIIVP